MIENNQIVAFPVCIKEANDRFNIYVPEIDYEGTASSFPNAIYRARGFILLTIPLKGITIDDLPEDLCSKERVTELLKQNHHEEYLDAEIVYVDVDLKEADIFGKGDFTIQLPKSLISSLKNTNINYTKAVEDTLKDVLRRKQLLDLLEPSVGRTAAINVSKSTYFGQIKGVTSLNEEPWNFDVEFQIGLYDNVIISSSSIESVKFVPVIFTEMGTYHLSTVGGQFSITGNLWWKRSHIDVYMEYQPDIELKDQKAFEYLLVFNENKYNIDLNVKNGIAEQLMDAEELYPLFQNWTFKTRKEKYGAILNEIKQRMNLWFINVTLNKDIYMDYNFENEFGKFTAAVVQNMEDDYFQFSITNLVFYESDVPDKEAELN